MNNWEQRITELEIRLALQDELLLSLNDTVAQQAQLLDQQQAQLRLLYQRQQSVGESKTLLPIDEKPPHY